MSPGRPSDRRSIATSTRFAIAGSSAARAARRVSAFFVGLSRFVVSQRTAELSRQVVALAAAEKTAGEDASSAFRSSLFRVEAGLLGATLIVTDEKGRVLRASEERTDVQLSDLGRLGAADATACAPRPWRGSGDAGCSSSRRLLATADSWSPPSCCPRSGARSRAYGCSRLACSRSHWWSRGSRAGGSRAGSRHRSCASRRERSASRRASSARRCPRKATPRRSARSLVQPDVVSRRRCLRRAAGIRRRRQPRDPHAAHLDRRLRRSAHRRDDHRREPARARPRCDPRRGETHPGPLEHAARAGATRRRSG